MDKQTEYVLRTIEERDIRFVRLWFTDVLGILKSVSIAPAELEGAFAEGIGFDGSAIEGFSRVTESDMLAKPDPSSFQILPWRGDDMPVARLFCDILLPDGSPSYADPYQYQNRLRDYRRADVGFSYVMTENNPNRPEGHWLKKFKDLSIGFEIFNLFNNQNAITNTWVRDVYTKSQYAVPNYLTSRVFNIKVSARL